MLETRHGPLPFAVGDRVQLTDTLKAARLYNGNVGTITGLDFLVPWDEVADLDCARAIKRLLDLTPDVVVWWDYSTASPTININRRANLAAVNVPVAAAGEGGLGTCLLYTSRCV